MLPGYATLLSTDIEHQRQHRRVHEFLWPILDELATTAPTTNTLPVGFAQFYDDGTTRRVYVNLRGVLYYWGLTAA